MRAAAAFLAGGVALGVFASIAVAQLWQESPAESRTVAELELAPSTPGGPEGVGLLSYQNGRVSGWVVVWGLRPGARHAVHFHGPDSSCGASADPVAVHPDLEADAGGVASARIDVDSPTNILRPGFYYNVHAGPSSVPDNPEIACGDIRPAR